MKYLLLAFLLLSGCASNEYREGCVDGIIADIKLENQRMGAWFAEDKANEDFVRQNVAQSMCLPLENARNKQTEHVWRDYPKGK